MIPKPLVTDVLPKLHALERVPFRDLFPGQVDLLTNKGHVGQLLCVLLGLPLDSARCDFADGELKTNKAAPDGRPLETMWIMQVHSIVDSLLTTPPLAFAHSELYRKIQNLVYLPVVKQPRHDHGSWYFLAPIHVQAPPGSRLFRAYESDYLGLCSEISTHLLASRTAMMHTVGGRYIQVRTKDASPYRPIRSVLLQRIISDKNRGFYFKKQFMLDAVSGDLPAS